MVHVFSLLAHGAAYSSEVLDHKARQNISILGMGTEGFVTYPCPSYILIHYYIHIYGVRFIDKLLTELLYSGGDVETNNHHDKENEDLMRDVRFLLRVNKVDREQYPANALRAYHGSSTILNVLLTARPNETLHQRNIMSKRQIRKSVHTHDLTTTQFQNSPYRLLSGCPNPHVSPNTLCMELIQPFGLSLYRGKNDTFQMITKASQNTLQEYCSLARSVVGRGRIIMLLISCKVYDTEIMMNFSPEANPIERIHSRSLTRMMNELKVTPTKKIKTKTKKRKRDTSPTNKMTKTKRKTSSTIEPPTL